MRASFTNGKICRSKSRKVAVSLPPTANSSKGCRSSCLGHTWSSKRASSAEIIQAAGLSCSRALASFTVSMRSLVMTMANLCATACGSTSTRAAKDFRFARDGRGCNAKASHSATKSIAEGSTEGLVTPAGVETEAALSLMTWLSLLLLLPSNTKVLRNTGKSACVVLRLKRRPRGSTCGLGLGLGFGAGGPLPCCLPLPLPLPSPLPSPLPLPVGRRGLPTASSAMTGALGSACGSTTTTSSRTTCCELEASLLPCCLSGHASDEEVESDCAHDCWISVSSTICRCTTSAACTTESKACSPVTRAGAKLWRVSTSCGMAATTDCRTSVAWRALQDSTALGSVPGAAALRPSAVCVN
mmetsp:Transcript_10166/g.25444  ORF Transcript_10166/g.25444 Transcript_10166/m.25444 type:complete len:357 (+) Transcript_10166:2369-3439(+)